MLGIYFSFFFHILTNMARFYSHRDSGKTVNPCWFKVAHITLICDIRVKLSTFVVFYVRRIDIFVFITKS